MEATLSSKNQATIPKQVREYLKLKAGRSVQVLPSARRALSSFLPRIRIIEAQRKRSESSTRPVSVEEMDESRSQPVQRSATANDRARYQCDPAISPPGRPRTRPARSTVSSSRSCQRIRIQASSTWQRLSRLCGCCAASSDTPLPRLRLQRGESACGGLARGPERTAGLRSGLRSEARNWESLKMP